MSIKFICGCGKHLRARDEMAARRSVCPRCGAPVGIPSLRPTHRGTVAAPLTPDERRKLGRPALPPNDAEEKAGPAVPPPVLTAPPYLGLGLPPDSVPPASTGRRRTRRRARPAETRWYECLLYPLRTFPLVLVLGLALTELTRGVLLGMPNLVALWTGPAEQVGARSLCVLVPLLILSSACAWLDVALSGGGIELIWSGRNVLRVLRRCLAWLLCLLAGPVELVVFAGWYWFHCGDPRTLDWLILAELGTVAVAYLVLELAAISEDGRLRDANPVRVARLVYRLGWRALLPCLAIPALFLGCGMLGLRALAELAVNRGAGWLSLAATWLVGLFLAGFLFRLLGMWCR
jgi:hypothetical protein